MKKSKVIFGVIVACLVLTIITLLIVSKVKREQSAQAALDAIGGGGFQQHVGSDGLWHDSNEGQSVPTTLATVPETTAPPVEIGDGVDIKIVMLQEGQKVGLNQKLAESDPEYMHVMGGDPYWSLEGGKIYRNDRTVSYTMYDVANDEIVTFRFGLAAGTYNRFLYLNPVCESRDNYSFGFDWQASAGEITTISKIDTEQEGCAYTVGRTMDDHPKYADFSNYQNPGAVWWTYAGLDSAYIDVLCFNRKLGDLVAVLRLTIGRSEDGGYCIQNIENRDLLVNNYESDHFTREELLKIRDDAMTRLLDQESLRLCIKADEPRIEDIMIVYRTPDEGMYYGSFQPKNINATNLSRHYSTVPILAVTCRNYKGGEPLTLYYQVLSVPSVTGRIGSYSYIGYDYPEYLYRDLLSHHE